MALRTATTVTASQARLRRFVFTLNNYTSEELEELKERLEGVSAWAVIGKEVGESGTSHLQGASVLHKQTAFSTVKRLMPRAHIEVMRGTPEDSLVYCSKEDPSPWIVGRMPEPGRFILFD